jgi:hypothetical protein
MAITDPRLREVVQALGDGGTMEMGERVLAWMDRSAPPSITLPTAPKSVAPPSHDCGVSPQNLLGAAEVAQMLGAGVVTVRSWTSRPQFAFPPPVVTLAAGKIWDREQVELWADGHPDLVGTTESGGLG